MRIVRLMAWSREALVEKVVLLAINAHTRQAETPVPSSGST